MLKPQTAAQPDDTRWASVFAAAGEHYVAHAFRLYRTHGLEPVLLKGWAASRNYPVARQRLYTDIDLAFASSEYDRAVSLSQALPLSGIPHDIHSELRQLDTLPWDDLISNSRLIDLHGEPIRLLRPEDHLRVLCVHFLTDGAWFRDRLWDIYYEIDRNRDSFDWSRCLDTVSSRRRRWIICVVGLAHKYLDLSLDGMPFAAEAKTLPKWFVSAVERQWQRTTRIEPLSRYFSDPRGLINQIRLRIPPEPIYSTVFMEGSFDARIRLHYQFGSMFKRAAASALNFYSVLTARNK